MFVLVIVYTVHAYNRIERKFPALKGFYSHLVFQDLTQLLTFVNTFRAFGKNIVPPAPACLRPPL